MRKRILQWPRSHQCKLLFTLLIALGLLIGAWFDGEPKTWAQIDMFDVLGEGAACIMALFWLWLLVISRPRGRVTNLLLLGTSLYWLTTVLDLADEFISYPDNDRLFAWLESIPVPIGMVLVTMGLLHWLAEQQSINRQLAQREHFQREHTLIDAVTQLYSSRYFMMQLQREVELHQLQQQPLSVALIDVSNFAEYNRQWGMTAGDSCLRSLASAIELRIRRQDLLCRYASDRFVLLLPETRQEVAQTIIAGMAAYGRMASPHPVCVSVVTITREPTEDAETLMSRLAMSLDWHKQCRYSTTQGVA